MLSCAALRQWCCKMLVRSAFGYRILVAVVVAAVAVTAVPPDDFAITVAITVVWHDGLWVTIVSLLEC